MTARRSAAGALCALVLAAAAQSQTLAERCAAGVERGDYDTCAAAVAERPGDPSLRRLYAQSLAKGADYQGSAREYGEVARLSPGDARAFYEHGAMLAFLRRYAEAAAPLEEAIRLRPDHAPSYRAGTIVYQVLKRPGDALRMSLAGAELGDTIAMFDVYAAYLEGVGTTRNDAEAFRWLVRAAEAGHVTAMDRLSAVYLNGGLGQKSDDAKAEEWATKARRARSGKL
jgi:TPR repeat protein